MIVQIKRILLLLWIYCLPVQAVFSQHTSNNNYTGAWETPTSWSPTWPVPQTNISGYNITINGYITVNGPLSFSGTCVLTINDTLVIKGDLSLSDNCDLTINNNGILIIRGNLTMHNHSEITANGYLIITGNIDKHGPNNEGSLTSNDNPVKVFVGGTISPANLTNNEPKYTALDCTSPPTTPYPHSGCSYGDMTDIITDPIYPFFQSTCTTATLTSSDADNSFCTGTSVTFTAGGGTNYNFRVNGTSVQNGGSTTYTTTTLTNGKIVDVIVTSTGGCTVTSSGITNTVFALPTPTFTVQPGATACSATNVTYTTQAGQPSYVWTFTGVSGTDYSITSGGTGTDNTVTLKWLTAGSKTVTINYTNAGGCTAVTAISSTATLVTLLPTPTFTVQPGATACSATNVIYTTQAGQTSYVWTFTGVSGTDYSITSGGTGTDNTVTVKWLTSGSKTVTINYTNAGGCTAATATSSTATLVNLRPTPTFTVQPGATACSATNVIYTTQAGQTSYVWTFTGVSGTDYSITSGGTGTDNTVTVKWLTAGSKTVTINYTNAGGCTAAAATSSIATLVTLLPTPTFTVQPGATVCSATNVIYTTQAGQTSYVWTFTGVSGTDYSITSGGTGTDNTVTVKWLTAGSKTVTINYTKAGGCTAVAATSSTATLVTLLPTPTLSGPTPVCIGATGNVYTTEAGMSNYTWSVSAGGTITAGGGTANNTATVTWSTTGAQSVSINYTNLNGCLATSSKIYNVTINPLPVTSASNNGPVCSGSALSLTGGPAGMTTYSWTGPNGFTSLLQNPSVTDNATLAMAGVYTLTITNASGCTGIATTTVTVNENPVAIAGPDQELTFIFETQMEAELSSPETGEWSLISGSGQISDLHSPTTPVTELSTGENIFLWKVQNGNCEADAEVKITVYDLFVSSVITPDGDGKNDYFKISENIGKVELIIFNRWGNEEYSNSDYKNDWDGRNNKGAELPYGTYFYILKLENGKIKKGSVLIKR